MTSTLSLPVGLVDQKSWLSGSNSPAQHLGRGCSSVDVKNMTRFRGGLFGKNAVLLLIVVVDHASSP